MKKALKAIARILHIKAARFAEPEWVAAYEEAARRVEGAPPELDMRRVWLAFDKWRELVLRGRPDYDNIITETEERRKIAALVRAELKRGGR